jgi:uncharacterized membrane protein YkvA (DUF1232 family)
MDSNDLRSRIGRAIKEDERTRGAEAAIVDQLRRTGGSLTEEQMAGLVGFIRAYVQETPDILDAVFGAAGQAGVLDGLRPVFGAAFQYWAEENDLIPDHLGLVGLTDDAYLSRHLMEVASGLTQQRTGRPLLNVDLGPPNRVMRGLLGEPFASQLDAVVAQTVAAQVIQAGLQQLAGFGAMFPLMTAGLGVGSYSTSSYENDVRLAAMGGPLPR